MKYAHYIKIKVFAYEKYNEDEKLILDKLLQLLPFEAEKEKVILDRTEARGFNERKIIIFEAILQKERHTGKFLESLKNKLNDHQRNILIEQIESRLDSDLSFFLRLDKEEYVKNDNLILTDSGNCFHIEINIAAFPRRMEAAAEIVKRVFQ